MPQWAGWALKAISGKFYKNPVATAETPTESGNVAAKSHQESLPNAVNNLVILEEDKKGDILDGWDDFEEEEVVKEKVTTVHFLLI